jgi:hypothetical protein
MAVCYSPSSLTEVIGFVSSPPATRPVARNADIAAGLEHHA